MAKRSLFLPLVSTILLLVLKVTESEAYSKTTPFEGHKPEKHTHFHFYFHDITAGANATAVLVASAPGITNSPSTYFGSIMILNNPLTEGPDRSSKEIGRAQGLYASSGMKTAGLTMALNFLFTEGEFKGSYIAMLGRNSIFSKLREMPIIGGSGALRFARGYAQAKTYSFVGLNAVVEYNVFVWY